MNEFIFTLRVVCAAVLTSVPLHGLNAQTNGTGQPGAIMPVALKAKGDPRLSWTPGRQSSEIHPALRSRIHAGAAYNGGIIEIPSGTQAYVANAPAQRSKSIIRAAADGRELWGCLRSSTSWGSKNQFGFYKFNAADNPTFSSMMKFDTSTGIPAYIYANAGSRLYDGILDFVYINTEYPDYYFYHYRINTETEPWEIIVDKEALKDKSLWALETATDNATGRVYGEFSNSTATALEFGEIDYNTMTRTTIGPAKHVYVALGLSKDGFMYGIDDNADLYKISLKDGSETLVGATGLTLKVGNATYEQSGEIDQVTNIFYWAAFDSKEKGALYTVDLTTGKATKLSDFSDNEQITALTIPAPKAEAGAPDAATDLKASFTGSSLSGTVSFKAPANTFGGGSLSGTLDYTVTDGKDTLASGQTEPGASVTADVTLAKSGSVVFTVTTSNPSGVSPKAKTPSVYVGFDIPKSVTDIKFDVDKQTGKAVLTWKAPDGGENGGYIGTLDYEVRRYPEGNVAGTVSNGATTFSETLPMASLTKYYYGVTPVNGDMRGEEAMSGSEIYGKAFEPPYIQTFDDESSFDFFTVINANDDDAKWVWYENQMKDLKCADYKYGSWDQKDGDDWMITPPVHLEAGNNYDISFKMGTWSKSYEERLEVKFGNANTPEAMQGVILEPTTFSTDGTNLQTYTKTIKADTDQDVYIGFHAITPGMNYHLFIDDIKIEKGLDAALADSVTNLTVTPAADGEQATVIKFNAPSKNVDGGVLAELTKVTIERDGELVKELTPKPGDTVEYKDTTAKTGVNKYTVTPYNSAGQGRSVSITTAYVGIDAPTEPVSATASDQTTAVRVAWKAPSEIGKNGGFVNTSALTYSVYALKRGAQSELEGQTSSTSFDVKHNTGEGEQEVLQYSVTAKNDAGESGGTYTDGIVVGKPYSLPFVESVPKGEMTSGLWWARKKGTASFRAVTSESVDGDGGCLGVENAVEKGDTAYIGTGKLDISEAVSPKLIFSHYTQNGSDHVLKAEIQKPDGTAETLTSIDYAADESLAGRWNTAIADLSAYKSLPYVIVRFCVATGNSTSGVYVDNINIRDLKQHDVSVAIDAPEKVMKGHPSDINVIVTNNGERDAEGYTVVLKEGDKTIGSKTADTALGASGNAAFTFSYTQSVFSKASETTLTAVVEYAPDQYTDDNKADKAILTDDSDKPGPVSVKAKTEGGNVVTISWDKPEKVSRSTTEDFDGYDPFIIKGIGDWKTIDVDKGLVSGITNSLFYENQNKPFAFITFDPEYLSPDLVKNYPDLKAHSGQQYMAALMSVDSKTGDFVDLDNWLISPTLSGNKQTVSLYVSNRNDGQTVYKESFEVLYSTGGISRNEFVKIGGTRTVSSGNWELVTVDLPAGATHFAIRQTTDRNNSWLFRIDDVTYEAGAGTVTGYNVYRDNILAATVKGGTETFTDTEAENGTHTYSVTAVYADGESMPNYAEPVIVTAIQGPEADSSDTYTVYNLDGSLVAKDLKSLEKLHKGAYIVNGKKMVVK